MFDNISTNLPYFNEVKATMFFSSVLDERVH